MTDERKYPATIINYLDGAYLTCTDCGFARARMQLFKAMELAQKHNTGDHADA